MIHKRTLAQLSLIFPLCLAASSLLLPLTAQGDEQCVTFDGNDSISGYISTYRSICIEEKDGACVKRGVESKSVDVYASSRRLNVTSHTRHDRYPTRTKSFVGCIPTEDTWLCRSEENGKEGMYELPGAQEIFMNMVQGIFYKQFNGLRVTSSADSGTSIRLYARSVSFRPVVQANDSADTSYCFTAQVKGFELGPDDGEIGKEKIMSTVSACISKKGSYVWSIPQTSLHVITSIDVTKSWKSKGPSQPKPKSKGSSSGKPGSADDADTVA